MLAMPQRIIWLRAVNVGGAKLPMYRLRELLVELGATEVATLIQTGNIVCVHQGRPDTFDRRLEQAIEQEFGFFREAISRSLDEVRAARAAYPFEIHEPKWAHITFLTEAPAPAAVAKARTFETGDDRWEVIGREWHSRYAAGAGRPQMEAAKIGKALGVPGTARNLTTVDRMISLAEQG